MLEKFWPNCKQFFISGQSALHVIVMKNVELPKWAAIVKESVICSVAHYFDPINDDGR
jgi:hypothetical protein